MGVNIDRVVFATFLLGGLMAGVAAMLYGLRFENTQYIIGFLPGIKAFTAAVLGGIGNLRGALLGGLVLGLVENYGRRLRLPVEGRGGLHRAGRRADVPADRLLGEALSRAGHELSAASLGTVRGPARCPTSPAPVGRWWTGLRSWQQWAVPARSPWSSPARPGRTRSGGSWPRPATGRRSCSTRSGSTSCWPSASTSWSAWPACSTSATSRSSPSARTPWPCSPPAPLELLAGAARRDRLSPPSPASSSARRPCGCGATTWPS